MQRNQMNRDTKYTHSKHTSVYTVTKVKQTTFKDRRHFSFDVPPSIFIPSYLIFIPVSSLGLHPETGENKYWTTKGY